jgi:hypothetical protein
MLNMCDFYMQSKMASLDGLSPPTNGLTIGLYGMVNVFLSTGAFSHATNGNASM